MARPNTSSRVAVERTIEAFEAFQQRLMSIHAPEFAALDLTMAQAKLLYVVTAAGELSMSEIARRLGVTVSTASGAVDHLVGLGLIGRSDDPANRRQVRVSVTELGHDTLEQLRELSTRQLRALFEVLDDDDLAVIEHATRLMTHAVEIDQHRCKELRMNRLTQLALSRRSVTLLLAAGLFIGGIAAWGSLKQELLPDVSFPIVSVIAPYPGAGASDVTEQVAKPIERSISSVPGLTQLQSTSANSFAFVVAQFDYDADLDEAVASIEENLRSAGLPDGVEPTVGAFNFNSAPVLVASVSAAGDTDLEAAAEIARTEIITELQSLPGVAGADLAGGLEDQLVVTLDPRAARRCRRLDPADRRRAAGQQSDPARRRALGRRRADPGLDDRQVRVGRSDREPGRRCSQRAHRSGRALGRTGRARARRPPLPQPVTLGELGTVEIVGVATTGYGRTNGQPSVTISVSKTSTANTVTVAQAAQAKLDEIAARHPGEITIVTVSDQSSFILESSEGLLREGGLGAVFAVLTIFLFLFNVRSTFVAAISIPLSILTALVVMQAAGITLNILTLGGLAVAVGRVVDDSIVVLENIYRHRALGDDRLTAVIQGPREVAGAITASTFTTVAVFLPLGFAGGFVSQFFQAFSLTVTFALLASLVVALTVVPVLAYFLVGKVSGAVDADGEPKNSFWVRIYDPAIRFVLRNRVTRVGTIARRRRPVRRLPGDRATAADGIHRLGLREDRPGDRGAAGRRELGAGARASSRGRGDPPGRSGRRARRHERPRRGRHRLPDRPGGHDGPGREQRSDDRPPRPGGRPRTEARRARRRISRRSTRTATR